MGQDTWEICWDDSTALTGHTIGDCLMALQLASLCDDDVSEWPVADELRDLAYQRLAELHDVF